MADVDWHWVDGVEPLSILFIAHCPFGWGDVIVILTPFSVWNEIYPWELVVVVLIAGVGLFKLHQTNCDAVLYVYIQIVGIIELVDEELRISFVAFGRWYRLVVFWIGAFTARVWAEVEVVL